VTEYDPNIIEHFDIENIVFLRDKMFQNGEFNTDSEELQSDNANEFDNNKLVGDKEIGQGVFKFDPTDLAADLMQEYARMELRK
ncbi:25413_t:CDS:1, partial [Gigaspora rosea]